MVFVCFLVTYGPGQLAVNVIILNVIVLSMSPSAWLSEDEDPVITQVNQRIADVTGLELETAEELQVFTFKASRCNFGSY